MWMFQHTESTTATPAHLWDLYADPTRWPRWDHAIAAVTLDGPMATGTQGTLKPAKGPKATLKFTEVTPEVGFTDVTRLPLARLSFAHHIEPTGAGCRFTHRVSITGPLAPLFGRVIGRRVAAELPISMRALADLAESDDW